MCNYNVIVTGDAPGAPTKIQSDYKIEHGKVISFCQSHASNMKMTRRAPPRREHAKHHKSRQNDIRNKPQQQQQKDNE
jgi:hypothetical protein